MRPAAAALLLAWLVVGAGAAAAGPQAFPLAAVRLQDGPLLAAQLRDRDTLLALDAERLLAPYRREAGLPAAEPPYGNWESSGLDGHMAGHYLSALAMMAAASDDPLIRERLDLVMAGLKQAQRQIGSGYLGGIPQGQQAWAQLAAGQIQVDSFSLNGRWVPWYNLHKIAAGLRDAHVHAAHPDALPMLRAFADWAERVTAGLSDAQMQASLKSEHGGMNELFADLAALSNNEPRYLRLARRFSHQALLQPLLKGEDPLTGLHANTQIPKVIGFARLAELGAEPGWLPAAQGFWQTVVERRTVAIGGNSVKEHFHDTANFQPMLDEVEGPETCNSVNMVRLSEALFRQDPQARYADYVERTLFNHLLASQHPQHGGFVYFTPMRPQHYRIYSATQEAMWCCVGSGLESHARHGAFVYAHEGETLYLNLFVASTLNWTERGVKLQQQTRFPDAARSRLVVEQGGRFGLRVRQPGWTRGMQLRLNGQRLRTAVAPDGYLAIPRRNWRAGDRVDILLPMRTTLEALPGRPDQVAVLHGPIVLAAKTDPFAGEGLSFVADGSRMGHIAHGPVCAQEQAPMFVAPAGVDITKRIRPVKGQALTFSAPGLIRGSRAPLQLIPFFRLHDARYMLYWPRSTPAAHASLRERLAQAEGERLALDRLTIDQVAPGEQQPESDHGFQGEGVETGLNGEARWRHARQWFAYTLNDPRHEATTLRLRLARADAGRHFEVRVNGQLLRTLALRGDRAEAFYELDLAIPPALRRDDGRIEVRFVAQPGSVAGGLYGLRLLRSTESPIRIPTSDR